MAASGWGKSSRSLAVLPTTLLHAADRDVQLHSSGHKHRGIDRPALPCAQNQLPFVEQDRKLGGVANQHLVDVAVLVDLADERVLLGRLRQAVVAEARLAAEDRIDG